MVRILNELESDSEEDDSAADSADDSSTEYTVTIPGTSTRPLCFSNIELEDDFTQHLDSPARTPGTYHRR